MDIYQKRIAALNTLLGGLTKKDFADRHDLDASYLSQILSGHRNLGERAAATMEKKIGVPAGTLVSPNIGEVSETKAAYAVLAINSNTTGEERPVGVGTVPVVGKAMLGANGFFDAIDYPVGHGDGVLLINSTDPNAYALQVIGQSMHPRIKHREFVVIEPNHQYVPGDEVLVRTQNGQSMVKEFSYLREGTYRFDSVNPSEPPVFLEVEEVEFIHFVGGIVKSSRFMSDT